jgi:hypothetical protein
MQKIETLREMKDQETLFGLAYNEGKREKIWVNNTPTWEVFP